eukprot:Clim_evm35s207 gene=Clim_evmTU35s207
MPACVEVASVCSSDLSGSWVDLGEPIPRFHEVVVSHSGEGSPGADSPRSTHSDISHLSQLVNELLNDEQFQGSLANSLDGDGPVDAVGKDILKRSLSEIYHLNEKAKERELEAKSETHSRTCRQASGPEADKELPCIKRVWSVARDLDGQDQRTIVALRNYGISKRRRRNSLRTRVLQANLQEDASRFLVSHLALLVVGLWLGNDVGIPGASPIQNLFR